MRTRFTVSFAALALATLFVVACGGHGPASPSAPTTPSMSTPTPAPAPVVTGTTLSGTVVGMSAASLYRTAGVSLTVTVSGTSLTATVDASGHFALQNVPAGNIELHFVGTGVDARVQIEDVAENETITVTIRVAAAEAEVEVEDREKGDEIEAEGIVSAMSAGSITVNGKTFAVTSNTQIVQDGRTLRLSDIHINDRVHVHGTMGSGSLTATKIQLKKSSAGPGPGTPADDDHGGDDHQPPAPGAAVELNGRIDAGSLGGSCSTNTLSFKVSGTTVMTSASTQFKDTQCVALKAGDSVEVKGTRNADMSVAAARVEKK
jgi:hypothetical protein